MFLFWFCFGFFLVMAKRVAVVKGEITGNKNFTISETI
jgi:hypothetical protein